MYTNPGVLAAPAVYGIGASGDIGLQADSDSWGGPLNSVDLVDGSSGGSPLAFKWHARLSVETWTAIVMIAALVGLWVIGGTLARKVNVI